MTTATTLDAPVVSGKWTDKEREAIRKAREKCPADTTPQRALADMLFGIDRRLGFARLRKALTGRTWNGIYHAIRKHDNLTRGFTVGDRVEIVKRDDDVFGWVPEMDATIGSVGVIEEADEGAYRVTSPGHTKYGWWYAAASLRKV